MRSLYSLGLLEGRRIVEAITNIASEEVKIGRDGSDPIAICVVGADGNIIAMEVQDNCMPASITVAQNKAYTCVRMRRNTLDLVKRQPPLNPVDLGDPHVCTFAGGVAVWQGDMLVGAIGVSGRKAWRADDNVPSALTDDELAREGIKAIDAFVGHPFTIRS